MDIFEQNATQNHPIHTLGNKIAGCEMRNTCRRMEKNFEKILTRFREEVDKMLVDILEQNAFQNHPIHIVGNKIAGCEMRNTCRRMGKNFEKMLRRF